MGSLESDGVGVEKKGMRTDMDSGRRGLQGVGGIHHQSGTSFTCL